MRTVIITYETVANRTMWSAQDFRVYGSMKKLYDEIVSVGYEVWSDDYHIRTKRSAKPMSYQTFYKLLTNKSEAAYYVKKKGNSWVRYKALKVKYI